MDLEGGFVVYPSNPPAAAGSQPPSTVKISTYLLWLVAAVSLITAIIDRARQQGTLRPEFADSDLPRLLRQDSPGGRGRATRSLCPRDGLRLAQGRHDSLRRQQRL